MELQLKNIGMIKEANVAIDGLTVIAGENDTGKSTVGKALFALIKATKEEKVRSKLKIFDAIFKEKIVESNYGSFILKIKSYTYGLLCKVDYETKQKLADFNIYDNPKCIWIGEDIQECKDIIFVETPLIWNFTDFFRDIAQVESQMQIQLDYPYLMKDLNFKLHIKSASKGLDIKEKVTALMGGEFKKDESDHYYFDKNGQRVELVNTATGIKQFAIFQVLSQNNYLNENTVLVLDEPEVHLHPKWQLEMAKIIVELVKNGVKVLVNSHSPYMIEALQRYSELADVKSDFYLAEDGYIKKENDSNSETLAKIFEKLSEPFDVFEEMDSQRMENLING